METQMDMFSGTKFKVKVINEETGVEGSSFIDIYTEDTTIVKAAINKAVSSILNNILEADMGEEKKDEQKQDLEHQKPEETDNLQKSARPDKSYCDDRGLNQDTLGKK